MPSTPRTPNGRTHAPDAEKITINLGFVDLGQIDLLVAEGFYGHRSDFIRTAIRNQLARHDEVVRQGVARRTLVLGLHRFEADALRAAVAEGRPLRVRVLGLAVIADDVSPELALAAIESIEVLGALHASPAVRDALNARRA